MQFGRFLVHFAAPDATRALAASMAGLSGQVTEFGGELRALPGGVCDTYNQSRGYSDKWWSASQYLAQTICAAMLQSGENMEDRPGVTFAAFDEHTGALVMHNIDEAGSIEAAPADASFEAFLVAIGCERVVPADV